MMRFGSLFAGIGGLDLGLERAGMECAWQVEIDPYAIRVLEKHWPEVTRHEDVRECGSANLDPVDLICGGFPCQDISYAGKGAGIEGERSGLWSEFYRIICELRPRFVLVENVTALLSRGLGRVLGDLAASGYDAEWESLPAAAFGAPHARPRVFILAHTAMHGIQHESPQAMPVITRREPISWMGRGRSSVRRGAYAPSDVAFNGSTWQRNGWGQDPPVMVGVADGVPSRVDRLRCLGNAVVPQVAEWIGRQIVEADSSAAPLVRIVGSTVQ